MGFFSRNKSNKAEYYLALMLFSGRGIAIILRHQKDGATIEQVDEKYFAYSNGWENLVDDIDELLLELEKMNKVTLEQVIFFLPSEKVTVERTIKKHYLSSIKKITKELNLKPLGFIEEHEALALFLQQKEDVPLTAIIIEFGDIEATVFHYQKGEIIAREHLTINSDFISELEATFVKFKVKSVLPSRVLVYGEDAATTLVNTLLNYRFDERLFIQLPHIKSVPLDEIKQAFLFSFSQQITGAVTTPNPDSSIPDDKIDENPEEFAASIPVNPEAIPQIAAVPGFVINEDISQTDQKDPTFEPAPSGKKSLNYFIQKPISIITTFMKKFSSIQTGSKKKNIILFTGIGLACLLVLFLGSIYYFHKAVVTIRTPQQEIKKDTKIEAVVDGQAQDDQLAIHKIEKETDTDASTTTTGKKTIGEKARGEVTIVNSTSDSKTFKSGTILTNPEGLEFTLDSDVTVASASPSSSDLNIVTGKAKANISASLIGPDGNIDKDERLKIEDFSQSTYFAQTNNKFTGGTKKDIQTVSKDDIAKLRKDAIAKISNNKTDSSQVTSQSILSDLTKVDLTDEQFSKELGEEATQVTLKAKGKTSYFTYNRDDLIKIASPLFKDSLPSGFTIANNDYTFNVTHAQETDSKIELTIDATAIAKKRVDKSTLLEELKGKSVSNINDLTHLDTSAEVTTFWPFLKDRLPFFKRNIILNIESK